MMEANFSVAKQVRRHGDDGGALEARGFEQNEYAADGPVLIARFSCCFCYIRPLDKSEAAVHSLAAT